MNIYADFANVANLKVPIQFGLYPRVNRVFGKKKLTTI